VTVIYSFESGRLNESVFPCAGGSSARSGVLILRTFFLFFFFHFWHCFTHSDDYFKNWKKNFIDTVLSFILMCLKTRFWLSVEVIYSIEIDRVSPPAEEAPRRAAASSFSDFFISEIISMMTIIAKSEKRTLLTLFSASF